MFNYILKRIWYGILVLAGVVILIFILFNILPGDPARMMLGQRADISSVEAINKELGRDKPVFTQFLYYVNDISPISFHNHSGKENFTSLASGKYKYIKLIKFSESSVMVMKKPYLRQSYQSNRAVTSILSEAFIPTLVLTLVSMLFATIFGMILGVFSALYKDSLFDRFALLISVIGMSLPSFFAAIIIAWFFAFILSDYTGLSMFGSLYSVDDFGNGEYLDLKNLILPALTLAIRPVAIITELMRGSVLDVLTQDYIRTARAKGLNKIRIITKHILRNSLNPVITAISGWFASLLAGAVFVEYVFDWKGMGYVIVDALEKYDFPVIMGAVLFISVLLTLINVIVDIIYSLLDPRIKFA